jgi:uncharacterized protein
MKVEGTYKIEGPRERVWRLMIDPEVLQRCVPGCQSLEVTEDGSYKISLKAGVGSIKGLFNGSIKLDELREPEHYKMIVDGKGSSGFLRGEGTLDLREEGDDTTVNYLGDVNVGGTIASVGQRMIQSSAKLMIGQFFAAIAAESKAISKAEETNEPFEPPKQGFIRNTIRQIKKI